MKRNFLQSHSLILIISIVLNCLFVGYFGYIRFIKTNKQERVFYGKTQKQNQVVEKNLIDGWNNTLLKLGVNVDVCFLGNSITYQSDFRYFFPDVTICNLGCPGDDISGMLQRIPAVQAVSPKKLFVMAGINDLRGKTGNELDNNYNRLVDALHDSLPDTRIYLQSILPVNNEDFGASLCDNNRILEANKTIKDIAMSYDMVYIDLFSVFEDDERMPRELTTDGIHLTAKAYKIWANTIAQIIYQKK